MSNDFVHLHVHTEYSLLDGLGKVPALVARANAMGMDTLAITDHGALYGVVDFYNECKKQNIKPIIGFEGYITPINISMRDRPTRRSGNENESKSIHHQLLLAANNTGYYNLMQLTSIAHLDGMHYKPRFDRSLLEKYSAGIITTTGCLAAPVPQAIMAGKYQLAEDWFHWYRDVFGERFFVELQSHEGSPELIVVNKWLIDYARKNKVKLIATNDVHYVNADDHITHDVLLCVQTGANLSDEKRMRMSDTSYYLKSDAEMLQLFNETPDAVYNTRLVADMCDVDLSSKGYKIPTYTVPTIHTEKSYLRELCLIGYEYRYGDNSVHLPRLEHELEVIGNMGFDAYFLIVWDICRFARESNIWYNTRGSAAGSIVAYCLQISGIEPVSNDLLFERFLNSGRVTMPDIDLDFDGDRRADMLNYTVEKYGEDRVAGIVTFGTMGAKAALKDVARVLNIDFELANKITKLIPQEAKVRPLMDYVKELPDLAKYYADPNIRQVFDIASDLQGARRNSGNHPAGVIVTDKPVSEYVPLRHLSDKENDATRLRATTQFGMDICESLGLLKIDFLGLKTLTVAQRACEMIFAKHAKRYNLDNIPYQKSGDEAYDRGIDGALKLMSNGFTSGIFQLEGRNMTNMFKRLRPDNYRDVMAGIALYRPGPMEYMDVYIQRKHGEAPTTYKHEKLIPILSNTYGIAVYQEQINRIAQDVFSYTPSEVDLMRRAVSKKKEKDLLEHRSIFLERGHKNGMDQATIVSIFEDIEFFANYGFNASHAASYAALAMKTAWLKAFYPSEYLSALLSVYAGDEVKTKIILDECRKLGIAVLPPSINYSAVDFSVDYKNTQGSKYAPIRFGLLGVKNVGEAAAELLVNSRGDLPFASLGDLKTRPNWRDIRRKAFESWAKVGAFDEFMGRNQALALYEDFISKEGKVNNGQMSMFSVAESDALPPSYDNVLAETRQDKIAWEKDLLGVYLTERPVDEYRKKFQTYGTDEVFELLSDIEDFLMQNPDGDISNVHVRFGGMINDFNLRYTKRGNDEMCSFLFEDHYQTASTIQCVCFTKQWRKIMQQYGKDLNQRVGIISGKLDFYKDDPQLIVSDIELF
jgi:DNA polymerase III subunit alpha